MIKKILAAFAVFIMVFSLCACNEQASGGGETTQATASTPAETQAQLLKYPQQMDYAEYLELTPEQQQEYYESFPDQESYMEWFNNAAQEYNQEQNNTNNEVVGNEVQITQPTQSQQGQSSQPTEKPTQKPTTSPQEEKDPVLLTYEEYLKLTPAQQQAYYESFSTPQAYMAWLNTAAQEYESSDTDAETEATESDEIVTEETEPKTQQDFLTSESEIGGRG